MVFKLIITVTVITICSSSRLSSVEGKSLICKGNLFNGMGLVVGWVKTLLLQALPRPGPGSGPCVLCGA